ERRSPPSRPQPPLNGSGPLNAETPPSWWRATPRGRCSAPSCFAVRAQSRSSRLSSARWPAPSVGWASPVRPRTAGVGSAMVAWASELLRDAGTRTCHIDWVVRQAFYVWLGYGTLAAPSGVPAPVIRAAGGEHREARPTSPCLVLTGSSLRGDPYATQSDARHVKE